MIIGKIRAFFYDVVRIIARIEKEKRTYIPLVIYFFFPFGTVRRKFEVHAEERKGGEYLQERGMLWIQAIIQIFYIGIAGRNMGQFIHCRRFLPGNIKH